MRCRSHIVLLIFLLVVGAVFPLTSVVHAQTLTEQERTTLILQLVQKVLELQEKIVALGGMPIVIPPSLAALAQGQGSGGSAGATTSCSLTKTLVLGARGEEVTCLQRFLIQQNLLTPDSATGYFGPLTRAAVIALQRQHGLEQVGHVGRLTRAVIAARTPSGTSTPAAPVSVPPSTGGGGGGSTPPPSSGGGGGGGGTPPSATSGYDIIIVGGQSNAVGAGSGSFSDSYANPTVDAQIMQLGRRGAENLTVIPATWVQGGVSYDALQHWVVATNRTSMGLAIPFARRYIAGGHLAAGRKVLIIPAAYGGTSILKWLGNISTPTTTPNALYDDMRNRTNAVLALPGKNRVVAFLWHQGESDVGLITGGNLQMSSPAVYHQKFAALVSKVRTDFPSSPVFPIIAGGFVPAWAPASTIKPQVESMIANVLADDVRGGFVSSTGLEANYPTYTTNAVQVIHFSSSALVAFGDRYYQMWRQLQSGGDTTAPSVSLTAPVNNATISGAVAFVAAATDNVGVAGVQFKIDGTNYGPERTTSPYVIPWVTASTTNGVHTVEAIARDAAGNRATSTITVLVANPGGFHCYFTSGIRVCHNAANEAVYSSVPNDKVAYNISNIRDNTTYYTVYHSEHRGAVAPEGGDSIQSGVTTGTYTGLMPAHDFRLWGNDLSDSTLAWYSIDAAGKRISGPGGGGNPIVISGLPGDPYFYVFFLGVADDDRNRIRGESDWRHYLIQARTQNFITYDIKTNSGWKPFSTATADTIRPAILTDAAGAALRSNAPKSLGTTQGLIGSMSYVNGTYHFFYGDYTPDGLSYNIYHRTTTNLATGTWSVPEVLFARGTDPKNRTMVRIAKAEALDRWLVLYGCYVTMLDGTQRQDVCLQYTNNLAVIGTGGLSSLSLTPNFALGFSDIASRSFGQPNLLTDRWGNQTHVNDAVNTGEFYWSDYLPSQCPADPRPGCPVYGGDVLRGGWNVKVL